MLNSTSDRMNEMNFRNPKIVSGLAFHSLELLIFGGLSPFGAYDFHRSHRFAVILFPANCQQDTGKPPFLVMALPT